MADESSGTESENSETNLISHNVPSKDTCDYETAIKKTGYGWFHWRLLLLCGWAVSSDAIEVLCVSFLLPSAECDFSLTSEEKGVLNSVIFVGMMFGGYFWGTLADIQGRRAVLIYSLAVNGFGGLLSTFAQTYWIFLLLRFVSGVGVGGSMPVIFSYFVEFQPKERRGTMISALATFWMGGNIICAAFAWLVIPHSTWGYFSPEFTYNSWRIFVALCVLPSLTSSLMFVLMPESPKFLLLQGRDSAAVQVLERVYRGNGNSGKYSIGQLVLNRGGGKLPSEESEDNDLIEIQYSRNSCGNFCKYLNHSASRFFSNTRELFRRKLIRITLIELFINVTLAYGYYGLWMWFPELFNRMESSGGSACDHMPFNASTINSTTNFCHPVDANVYFEGFLTAVSNLPGNILTIFIMDKIGGRILLAIAMVLSGVSVFFLWFVHNKVQGLIMSCLFGGISTVGWNALDVLSAEMFPTELRASAIGFLSACARIAAILGNLTFGYFVDVNCAVPMLLVAGLLGSGGLSALLLPNRTGQEID